MLNLHFRLLVLTALVDAGGGVCRHEVGGGTPLVKEGDALSETG